MTVNVTQIIQYLRANLQTPNVNGSLSPAYRIDGAGSLPYAKDDSRIMTDGNGVTLPSLFVIWGECTATVRSVAPLDMNTDQRIIILACVDNTQDRTGKYAQNAVPLIRQDLFNYLFNYRIDMNCLPLQFVRDQMAGMDRARYWHQFEFALKGRLQPQDGAPLANISVFNTFTSDFNSPSPTAPNPLAQGEVDQLYYPPGVIVPPEDNKE